MNARVKTIFDEARLLTPEQREELAELLLDTIPIDPEIEQAWSDEIADRIAAHERGELPARPAADVLRNYLDR
ncbi:MAG: addiction module protein [Hyphomicrobium sp.]